MISCMSQKRNTWLFKDELDETCQGFVNFQWYLTMAIGNRHVPCHTQDMIKHVEMDPKQVKEFRGIFQISITKNLQKHRRSGGAGGPFDAPGLCLRRPSGPQGPGFVQRPREQDLPVAGRPAGGVRFRPGGQWPAVGTCGTGQKQGQMAKV